MSEDMNETLEVAPAANAASLPKGALLDDFAIVDLTLSDSDDDNAPPPASIHYSGGRYAAFSKYGQSLRPRKIKQEIIIPQERGSAEEEDSTTKAKVVVTPHAKKKKSPISSSSSEDCSVSSSDNDNLRFGAVGYAFHKQFIVGDGPNAKTEAFHGVVEDIIDRGIAKNGKDRRVVYNDNESEYLSLADLRKHVRCLDKNCAKVLANSTKNHPGPPGKVNLNELRGGESEEAIGMDVSPSDPTSVTAAANAIRDPDIDDLFNSSSTDESHDLPGKSSQKEDMITSAKNQSDPKNQVGDKNDSDDDESLFSSSEDESDDDVEADKDMENQDTKSLSANKKSDNNEPDKANSDDESLFSSSEEEDDDDDRNFSYVQVDNPGHAVDSDDESLFPSSGEEEEEEAGGVQFYEENDPDDENESTCSRFSHDSENTMTVPLQKRRKKPKKKLVKQRPKSLITDYVAPPERRKEREAYYFAIQWGARMQKERLSLPDGPPKSEYCENGVKYRILVSKLVTRKGKGITDDRMGNKTFKSHYLGVSGPGLKKMNLKKALLSIADFRSLTHDKGAYKTVSRLELLASPACRLPGDKDKSFCIHRLDDDQFEVIEDDGHLGCGFIPTDLLVELLGSSVHAQRAFGCQVRIVGPLGIGIAKGMLFVKDGIDRVQVPTSMIKVEKSKSRKPLHIDVILNVNKLFPSTSNWYMGRLFDDNEKDPTDNQKNDLHMPCADVRRVLRCKGVEEDVLEGYMTERRLNHANLVGVSDPTGTIPSGHVFLTGMGRNTPSRVFLTRNPCTEGKDGMIVEVASYKNMPEEAFEFLSEQRFGAVVFPLGDDPLPPKINDGDLDGDLYVTIWDEAILDGVSINTGDEIIPEFLSDDDVVGIGFPYHIDGVKYHADVVQKIQENPDLYRVETGPDMKTIVELTRQEIFETNDYLTKVVDHRSTGGEGSKSKRKRNNHEFNCEWYSGKKEWLSTGTIRTKFDDPPQELVEYAHTKGLLKNLPERFSKWLTAKLFNEEILEVINHKTNTHGEIEILCRYTDDDEVWHPMEEVRKTCKIFLGAYAQKCNLFSQPGWEKVDGYWLEEVHDLMCNQNRSNEISGLVSKLYAKYTEAFDKFGGNHEETLTWGRTYKESLEIGKHGGNLELPFHLYRRLPKTVRKYVDLK